MSPPAIPAPAPAIGDVEASVADAVGGIGDDDLNGGSGDDSFDDHSGSNSETDD